MFIISQTRITSYFKSIISRVQASSNDQKKHEVKVWKTKKNNHTNWALICSYISKLFARTKFVKSSQSKLQNFKENENVKFEIVESIHDYLISKSASILSKIKYFKNDHFSTTHDDLMSTWLSIKSLNLCRYFSSSFNFFQCSRVCRICHEIFDFNNVLHKYLKINHRSLSFRRL